MTCPLTKRWLPVKSMAKDWSGVILLSCVCVAAGILPAKKSEKDQITISKITFFIFISLLYTKISLISSPKELFPFRSNRLDAVNVVGVEFGTIWRNLKAARNLTNQ